MIWSWAHAPLNYYLLPSVHPFAPLKYIENHPDVSWLKATKSTVFSWEIQEEHVGSIVPSILPPASQKENVERKEAQSSILQIAIYI